MRGGWIAGVVVAALVVAGCSAAPKEIRSAPGDPPTYRQSVAEPDRVAGERIRWGGTIVSVRHEADATWVEIVERPLQRDGRPREVDRSTGRFLARVDRFLDPVIYVPDRPLTVVGTLDGVREGRVGDYVYRYPVVAVAYHYLWPPLPEPRRYYDPWYDPWYPYSRYPRYYHGPYRPYW